MHVLNHELSLYSLSTWQSQLMASDHNLIDFSSEGNGKKSPEVDATPTTVTTTIVDPVVSNTGSQMEKSIEPAQLLNTAKSGISKFEITRVETRGDNVGGDADDSELDMDDSVSENNESNSVVVPNISQAKDSEAKESKQNNNIVSASSSSSNKASSNNNTGTNDTTALQQPLIGSNSTSLQEPTQSTQASRFRIVKIAKQKPYERGTWMVNDFNDTQKQSETTETAPSSPVVKRNKNPMSEGGTVTSPTEPVKTKSSEFLAHHFSTSQSRGSSYNTERRSSIESTTVSDSVSTTPHVSVTPMVEALVVAMDQIQTIKDSLIGSVSEEMKKLRETLAVIQVENGRLKEENEQLKQKLTVAEERLATSDKG